MNNYIKVFKKVLIICLIFLASASLYSQNYIYTAQDFANMVPNGSYILMDDITVTQMYTQTFTGHFDGNNKKITVNINENVTNVGLFSQVDGGSIYNLIVDGSVVGGLQSENVGGFVGEFLSGDISICTNLADVTGESFMSSVGGISGAVGYNGGGMIENNNNGTITGGQYVAGIAGKTSYGGADVVIKYCRNAGTIMPNKNRPELSYVAGIIAYCDGRLICDLVNIGKILGSDFDYAGGIVARLIGGYIAASCNSGIVAGAKNSVGGIVGLLDNARLEGCINTNWIDIGTAQNYGAIVGMNNGTLTNNYFDNQMCVLNGIGNVPNPNVPWQAEGMPTTSMLGTNLRSVLLPFNNNTSGFGGGCNWVFTDNLYPRLGCPASQPFYDHPISLLAAAPIYLQDNPITGEPERLDYVTQPFTVSNGWAYPPPPPPNSNPYNYPYQWGWFNQGYIPFSANGFIEIVPLNNANIIVHGGGQDSLSVQLEYNWLINTNYNGFYSGNYNIIFEKIVPIYVGI